MRVENWFEIGGDGVGLTYFRRTLGPLPGEGSAVDLFCRRYV